ncbi:MAG: TnsA endonuclease N-terminal domain-containing protein [Thermoplasmata archaeon]
MSQDNRVYLNPKKSAYSLEYYDSEQERAFMDELERDDKVTKWTKNHGIRILYTNVDDKLAHYIPDFLIEYYNGDQEIVEIKGKHLMNNPLTKRKAEAAREWCKKRGIKYTLKEV